MTLRTTAINVASNVDTTIAGEYTVTYQIEDITGNFAQAVRTVSVVGAQPPAAPSNLTASVQFSGNGRNKIKTASLSWSDNSVNEDEFVIERCKEEGKGRSKTCVFSQIASVDATVTVYVDDPGTGTFKYRVMARNAQGDSPYSNEVKI